MYEDGTGYKKREIQKRKIVETEIFSVDKRIKIGSSSFLMGNTIFNSRSHWIFGDYYEETHTKQRIA